MNWEVFQALDNRTFSNHSLELSSPELKLHFSQNVRIEFCPIDLIRQEHLKTKNIFKHK